MAIFCINCGASLPDGAAFCDACGTPVRGQRPGAGTAVSSPETSYVGNAGAGNSSASGAGSVVCPVCGASALPGEAFCDNCGASLLPSGLYSPVAAPVISTPPAYSNAPLSAPQPAPAAPQAAPYHGASLVITSPPPPATLSIPDRAEMIVGRSDPQSNSYPDVDLGPYGGLDLGVSRRHFRLARTGDQFYVEDLGSVNGTIVNGQRIPSHNLHPLRTGDRITLGKMEIMLEMS